MSVIVDIILWLTLAYGIGLIIYAFVDYYREW